MQVSSIPVTIGVHLKRLKNHPHQSLIPGHLEEEKEELGTVF